MWGIVADEQRRMHPATPLRPSGDGRRGAICGVVAPNRQTRIAFGATPCIWPHGARHAGLPLSPTGS